MLVFRTQDKKKIIQLNDETSFKIIEHNDEFILKAETYNIIYNCIEEKILGTYNNIDNAMIQLNKIHDYINLVREYNLIKDLRISIELSNTDRGWCDICIID